MKTALDAQKGDFAKVVLPGERTWVEVLERDGDMMKGRLDAVLTDEERASLGSELFGVAEPLPKIHDFKAGQEVWFEIVEDASGRHWEPIAEGKVQ